MQKGSGMWERKKLGGTYFHRSLYCSSNQKPGSYFYDTSTRQYFQTCNYSWELWNKKKWGSNCIPSSAERGVKSLQLLEWFHAYWHPYGSTAFFLTSSLLLLVKLCMQNTPTQAREGTLGWLREEPMALGILRGHREPAKSEYKEGSTCGCAVRWERSKEGSRMAH